MKLHSRLDELEENLSPKELVTVWMEEAHSHGDLLSYGTWLLTQPDDAYPLIRLPALIYRHSPVSKTRVCEERDRAALRASYRDLLFHFHLHSQINERILHELPEIRVWGLYLHERLARLTDEAERSKPDTAPRTRRSRQRTPDLTKWRVLRDDLELRVCEFLDAADLLSRRYFAGADLLYPDIRRDLGDLLEFALTLHSLCNLTFGSPKERRRAIDKAQHLDERGMQEGDVNAAPTRDAHHLAQELVVMARAEALTTLGEHRQGVDVVEAWMREHDR